jgi:hypothetical protein
MRRSPKEWIATDCKGRTRSVRRTRRFPVPLFVIAKGSETLATIQCTGISDDYLLVAKIDIFDANRKRLFRV